jgi:ABC-type multidrug transport system permease subunit
MRVAEKNPKALFDNCFDRAIPVENGYSDKLSRDAPYYVLAALCGIATGCADVLVNDLLFTALIVLASCMVLGIMRRSHPWRWVIALVIFVPLTEWVANMLTTIKPTHAQIYGSFLTVFPGIAGAYGGSQVRTAIDNLREGK